MVKRLGLDWRIPLYKEYVFYIRSCKNFREILDARQKGTLLDQIQLRNGLVFFTVGPSRFILEIFREIWQHRTYLNAFPGIQPETVVDIGAHVGFFSLQAALTWPHTQVYAYEPAPENYTALCKNIQTNKMTNIHPSNEALGEQARTHDFYLKQQSESHSLYPSTSGGETRSIIQVKCIDMDEIVERIPGRKIDFLKMDCEGCEFEAVVNQVKTLRRSVGFVAMEFHLNKKIPGDHTNLIDILEKHQFKVSYRLNNQYSFGFLWAINQALTKYP
jgi:FkbM family methyltransferase